MKLWETLRGARPFAGKSELLDIVQNCEFYDSNNEDVVSATLLLIFSTSSQKSWLICTSQRLYFVLDDLSYGSPEVKWRRVRDHLIKDGRVTLNIKLEDRSDKTGRVSIGRMNKGFLYTKSLFLESGIKGRIYSLIEDQMIKSKTA